LVGFIESVLRFGLFAKVLSGVVVDNHFVDFLFNRNIDVRHLPEDILCYTLESACILEWWNYLW